MPKRAEDQFGSINPPQYDSVAFAFNSVEEAAEAFAKYGSRFAYGRMGNPSVRPFEEWFAEFEGAERGAIWATNTGMAAIKFLIEGCTSKDLGRGKRIVASPYLYGGTHHLLEFMSRNGLAEVAWVHNPFDLSEWRMVIAKDKTALVLLETPANPTIDIFDIGEIAAIAHSYDSRLVVDNTLGVGLERPLKLGADGVVYSVTKALNRKSSELGGALVVSHNFRKEIEAVFDDIFVHSGIIMHPKAALDAYSNRTTLVRDMILFSKNALLVAEFLETHPKVKKVNYPALRSSPHFELAKRQMPNGAGGLLSFELQSFEMAKRFVEEQKTAYLAVHLGDGNNHLVTHPASTTHSKLSLEELEKLKITPGLVRMSVSLGDAENMKELINDFKRALDVI